MTPSAAEPTISTETRPSRARYGRKSRMILCRFARTAVRGALRNLAAWDSQRRPGTKRVGTGALRLRRRALGLRQRFYGLL